MREAEKECFLHGFRILAFPESAVRISTFNFPDKCFPDTIFSDKDLTLFYIALSDVKQFL